MINSMLPSCRSTLFVAAIALSSSAIAQTDGVPPNPTDQKQQKPITSVDPVQTLQVLLRAIEQKRSDLDALKTELRDTKDKTKQAELNKKLAERLAEVTKLERDFESVATGIDLEAFWENAGMNFRLGKEIETLLQPMIQQLKEVTKEPRQIEQLRNEVEARRQRAKHATEAIVQIQRLLAQSPSDALARELRSVQQRWQTIRGESENQAEVAQLQLDGKLAQRKSLVASSQVLIGGFFKNRGLNLLLATIAFLAVMLGMRLFSRPIRRMSTRRRGERETSFYARMLNITFYALTTLIALAAALMVLYAAGDWLLLGLALLFLFGVIWASKNTIPKVFDQVRLMLNLGAVREHERVIFNGVPWRVESLNVYTRLVNPDLSGGMLRLPIRHLIGLHSRPTADREVWFPCREGDWIIVGDSVRGRVVSQTPDTVQLVQLGGARVTYQTAEFLSQNPKNLSKNFRVRVTFGVDYQHQAIVTTLIPTKMQDKLVSELELMLGEDKILNINVEFKEAGSSSLDLEVLADFSGDIASRYEAIRRAIQRILVDACNENGWVIPFTQLTLHQAKAS